MLSYILGHYVHVSEKQSFCPFPSWKLEVVYKGLFLNVRTGLVDFFESFTILRG